MKKIDLNTWETRFDYGIRRVIFEKVGLSRSHLDLLSREQFSGYYDGIQDYLSEEA